MFPATSPRTRSRHNPIVQVQQRGVTDNDSIVKVSNWFILINSNVSGDSWTTTKKVERILLRARDKIFGTDNSPTIHFNDIFKSGEHGKGRGAGAGRVLQPYMSKIGGVEPKIDIRSVTEVGTMKKRVHLHLDLAVTHYGSLMLDYQEFHRLVRKYISEDPENCTEEEGCLITNPFISIKHYQSRMGALAYMTKGKEFLNAALEDELFSEDLTDTINKNLLDAFTDLNISTRPSEI